MYKLREIHWKAVLRIQESPGKSLLHKKYENLRIESFLDSNYAKDKRDRKSTSGYYSYVGGNMIT